jgi:uncharacterized Fe-S radical SAM superfamily protein PflX
MTPEGDKGGGGGENGAGKPIGQAAVGKAEVVIKILRMPNPLQPNTAVFGIDAGNMPPQMVLMILSQLTEEARFRAYEEMRRALRVQTAGANVKLPPPPGGGPAKR